MSIPYYTRCQFCGIQFATISEWCATCETDEGLVDEPFEVKDR